MIDVTAGLIRQDIDILPLLQIAWTKWTLYTLMYVVFQVICLCETLYTIQGNHYVYSHHYAVNYTVKSVTQCI